jgi:hypothetical protein
MHQHHHETLLATFTKTAPAAAAGAATAVGVQLSDITLSLTIIYTSIQLCITIRNLIREYKLKAKENKDGTET